MSENIVTHDSESIRRDRDVYDAVYGTGGPDDPVIAFCDTTRLISTEQYSYNGRWRGWKDEYISSKKEYFKRKLVGK